MQQHPLLFYLVLFVHSCGRSECLVFHCGKAIQIRERDDRPYDKNLSVVEEIFDQCNLMRSPTPDYDDLDA